MCMCVVTFLILIELLVVGYCQVSYIPPWIQGTKTKHFLLSSCHFKGVTVRCWKHFRFGKKQNNNKPTIKQNIVKEVWNKKINEDNTLLRVSSLLSERADAESQLWGWKLIFGTEEEGVMSRAVGLQEQGGLSVWACVFAEPATLSPD